MTTATLIFSGIAGMTIAAGIIAYAADALAEIARRVDARRNGK